MEKKLNVINKIFPWFSGLSDDLIFYIAINTIWLTTVKGFSAAEITFLTTIGSLFAIIFQFPMLAIMKSVGNTNSIRIGSVCLFISSMMLTFSTQYIFFAIASIFLEMALVFNSMGNILIKDNLRFQNRENEYIKIRSKGSLIYAISTAVISLLIGPLFNLHEYLPMVLGIVNCLICFILSLFIFDIDDVKNTEDKLKREKRTLPKPFRLCIITIILYGLFFGLIVISQSNAKLLIQDKLAETLSVEMVATYLGIVLLVSRLARVLVSYLYPKIYKKYGNNTSIILAISLLTSFVLILLGYYINANLLIKIIIMTIGFSFLPSLRDPVKIYTQALVLETFDKKRHKEIFSYLSLCRHIGKFVISALVSAVLLKVSLQYVFILFLIGTIPIIYLSLRLRKEIRDNEKKDNNQIANGEEEYKEELRK